MLWPVCDQSFRLSLSQARVLVDMRAAPPVLVEASLAAGRRKLAAVGGNGGARRKQSRSPSKSCKETRVSFKNKVSGKMLVGTLTQVNL